MLVMDVLADMLLTQPVVGVQEYLVPSLFDVSNASFTV